MAALSSLRDRYLQAQLAGDRRAALRVVLDDGLGQGASVRELQQHVVGDAQREIGRLWQLNQVSIAQEHMATAISQLVLSSLFERARAAAPLGKTVVIACVEGELHDLPARLVADLLELEGFDVRFLGANLPAHDLAVAVAAARADLIGLSVTMSFNLGALRAAVSALREVSRAPIFVGGHGLRWAPGTAAELGVEVAPEATDELLAVTRRLAGIAGAP